MRLASYDVENLFDRPKAMTLDTWDEGKPVLDRFAALNALLGELIYTAAVKRKMSELNGWRRIVPFSGSPGRAF